MRSIKSYTVGSQLFPSICTSRFTADNDSSGGDSIGALGPLDFPATFRDYIRQLDVTQFSTRVLFANANFSSLTGLPGWVDVRTVWALN